MDTLQAKVDQFEEVDTKVNLRDLVKEKNDFQQTYRTLTKSNVQNKL